MALRSLDVHASLASFWQQGIRLVLGLSWRSASSPQRPFPAIPSFSVHGEERFAGAIQQILCAKATPGRLIWYVVDAANLPSIRMVEKLGFLRVGVGTRSKRLGFDLLGQFVMDRCEAIGEPRW